MVEALRLPDHNSIGGRAGKAGVKCLWGAKEDSRAWAEPFNVSPCFTLLEGVDQFLLVPHAREKSTGVIIGVVSHERLYNGWSEYNYLSGPTHDDWKSLVLPAKG